MKKNVVLHSSYKDQDIHSLLLELLECNDGDEITVNLKSLKFCEVGPLALILAFVRIWKTEGKSVSFATNENMGSHSYLQRIDFFSSCGLGLEENFVRRDGAGRFVPFQLIARADSQLADVIGERVADCIAPETEEFEFTDHPESGYYEALAYSVSELVKNVQQHSAGTGYIVAQHYQNSGCTKIAVVDDGIGVRQSFISSRSPHAQKITSDLDALQLAIQAEVSSKTHIVSPYGDGVENAGVGLSLLVNIALNAGGSYTFISGAGLLDSKGDCVELNSSFGGTFVCFSFKREELAKFQDLLENAKQLVLGEKGDIVDFDLESIFN